MTNAFNWRGPTKLDWPSKSAKQIKQDAERKNKHVNLAAYKERPSDAYRRKNV